MIAARIPGKAETGRKIVLVRKEHASGGAWVARNKDAHGRVRYLSGLLSKEDVVRPPLGVQFGRVVLIAQPEGNGEVAPHPPLILRKNRRGFCPYVVGSVRALNVVRRVPKQKIRKRIAAAGGSISSKVEISAGEVAIGEVVGKGPKVAAKPHRVFALLPAHRIGVTEGRVMVKLVVSVKAQIEPGVKT